METNNSQKENQKINNIIEEDVYFEIVYKHNKDKIRIFDNDFINKNKDKCKIIYKNKEYELKEYFEDIDNNYKNKEEISFILRINKNITDISYMFYNCVELLLIRDITNVNYSYKDSLIINDMQNEINYSNENEENDEIFNQNKQNNLCKDLEPDQISSSLSNITNKNKDESISNNFLPNNIYDEDNLINASEYYNFYNVTNMSYMFWGCKSLISLPDISKWNTSNVTNMREMFYKCKSLISLPDIAKCHESDNIDTYYMINECFNLLNKIVFDE